MSEESPSPLTRLQTPDEMALIFNPVGLGGRMEPEDAARFQTEAIAAATLVDAVPTEIKENFERARKLHLYGVLEYEFFTAAPDYALLVLEAALRAVSSPTTTTGSRSSSGRCPPSCGRKTSTPSAAHARRGCGGATTRGRICRSI